MQESTPTSPPSERLIGAIERVTFHSEATQFCVLRVNIKGQKDPVTVVGRAVSVSPGEFIECEGQWRMDRTHGLQFAATALNLIQPTSRDGIFKYLSSGMIKGIGPHFAKQLMDAFGDEVFDVIENQPERLRSLPGIGETRLQQITQAWKEQRAIREIMTFLHTHGVGTQRAVKIYKKYGTQAIEIVKNNPYKLALDIHGIGFKTADSLGQQLGIPNDALVRAQAGLRHCLTEHTSSGHCAIPQTTLLTITAELLDTQEENVSTALEVELAEEQLIAATINDERCIYLASLFYAEKGVAAHLTRLSKAYPPWPDINLADALPKALGTFTLSPSQEQALTSILQQKVSVMTGGPGVGKTTLLNTILKIVARQGVNILLSAPTGRAAKRLSEATQMEAKTLHRLLEYDPSTRGFKRHAENPLDVDLLVIDECSMVDIALMNQVLRAIPDHAALLLVGDVNQLPSVGPGRVLADIINSDAIPVVRLTEIFRQAAASQIITNAHRIHQGETPLYKKGKHDSDFYLIYADSPDAIQTKLLDLVTTHIPKRFHVDPIDDIQVLTPMNRSGLGTKALNAALQARLNANAEPKISRYGSTFSPGDKVIQTRNNYDKDVFNGDIGRIQSIDLEESQLVIRFDGRDVPYELHEMDEIALAYATTIHKSQGSEYPVIVMPLAMQHFMMLQRNLLYTGVTRGTQLVILIAESKALAMAVKKTHSDQRVTNLQHCLQHGTNLNVKA